MKLLQMMHPMSKAGHEDIHEKLKELREVKSEPSSQELERYPVSRTVGVYFGPSWQIVDQADHGVLVVECRDLFGCALLVRQSANKASISKIEVYKGA